MTPYVDSRDGRSLSIYMDLNAKYGKLLLRCLRQSIQIRISPKRGTCTWNSNLQTKCWTERRFHAFKFSDGYKSTMDWCSVYLTPQALPKYIYLSPPLIFPTTSTELGQKTARCESLRALLVKNWNLLFYCSNIAKSENAMLWRMLSRLETCIVYCCIWSVTLAKSIVPSKTWRKLWHS
jgi:hypothetical protein